MASAGPTKFEIEFDVFGIESPVNAFMRLADMVQNLGAVGGAAGALGAVAAAVGIVGAAVFAANKLKDAMEEVSKSLLQFARQQALLAGTGAETGTALALGRLAGISDIASLAHELRQERLNFPGVLGGSRLGLPFAPFDITRAFDEAANFANALRRANEIARQDPGQGQLLVRQLPALAPFSAFLGHLTDEDLQRIEAIGKAQAEAMTPARVEAAKNFALAMADLATQWERLKAEMAPLVNLAAMIVNLFSTLLGSAADLIHEITGEGMRQATAEHFHQALKSNTRALGELNQTLRDFPSGIFGGGERARTALPGAFGPQQGARLNAALRDEALKFGAYSLGR